MSILSLLLILALIGFALWAVNTYLPMDGAIKKIMNVVVLIAVFLWLLSVFGVLGNIGHANVPRL